MRVPLSWLREFVELPDAKVLAERLTVAGLEVNAVEVVGRPGSTLEWGRDAIVLAKVLRIEKHPNADTLKMVTVEYGAATTKTVITGAPNIAPGQSGMTVVLGLAGSRYFTADKEGKKSIATLVPKDLRGILNDAMCMSNFELGIADDHDGILLLDDADGAPGTPAADVLGDVVFEIDVLPNMARCFGMMGVAREVSALSGKPVCVPNPDVPTVAERIDGKVTVAIEDVKLCPRYSATLIRNVTVGPSPRLVRSRLQAAGERPISNAVDVTNYVMLETGQPLHAFDFDVLVKRANGGVPAITVRRARAGEKLVTLDSVVRELTPDHLVIADAVGPIALAGVRGGLDTEVTAATTSILLEAAAFDPVSVRKTARHFTLFSEASTRYARGVHPELVPVAAKRAAKLLAESAGGEVLSGVVEAYPAPLPPQVIELSFNEVERVLGFRPLDGEIDRILTALQFTVTETLWGRTVTVPPTRLDLQAGAADLIEEIARVLGYDELPSRLLAQELPPQSGNDSLALEQKVQDTLVDLGLSEAINYSLTGEVAERGFADGLPGSVKLLNPLSPERGVMRRTLVPGLLAVANENLEPGRSPVVALFELGPVFHAAATGSGLPDEPRRLALVLAGRRGPAAWDDALGATPPACDFYDLKGVVEALFAALHLPAATFTPAKEVPHLHPGRAATVSVNGLTLGTLGELHPRAAKAFKHLAERRTAIAEFDFDALAKLVPARVGYRPVSAFPPTLRDLAVVVPADTPAESVTAEIVAGGAEFLEAATLFDVYRGDSIPPGTKSLAYALAYRVAGRQLGDKEVDKAHLKIEGRLKHVLKASIRGKA